MRESRLLILALLGFLLMALVAAPRSARAQGPDDLCKAAKQYLDEGKLAQAEEEYNKVLEEHKDEPCAVEGLRLVYCQQAEQYFKDGKLAEALEKYLEVQIANPEEQCMIEGLPPVQESYCQEATKLLDQSSVAEAKQIFEKLKESDPELECAKEGLRQVSCEKAKQHFNEGQLALAEEKYNEVLKDDPKEPCAKEGLRRVHESRCQLAKDLFDIGLTDDAKKMYENLRKSDPELECAVEGLKAIAGLGGKIDKVRKAVADPTIAIGRFLLTGIVLLLVVVLIVYLVVRIASPESGLKSLKFLRGSLARLRRRQTVVVEFENATDEKDHVGKIVRARMIEKLRELLTLEWDLLMSSPIWRDQTEDQDRWKEKASVSRQVVDDAKDILKELAEKVQAPEIQYLVLIVQRLFPVPGTKVGGTLLKTGSAPQRHGLTVELADLVTEELEKTRTFWYSTSGGAAQSSTSEPGAGAFAQNLRGGDHQVEHARTDDNQRRRRGDSQDDDDDPYYKLGKRFADTDQYDQAVKYLEEALKRNPDSQKIKNELANAVTRRAQVKGVRSAYDVATKLHSLQLLDQAAEYYIRALSSDNDPQVQEVKKAVSLILDKSKPPSERARAFHYLGERCRERHLRAEAEAFFGNAVENEPDNETYKQSLGALLADTVAAYKDIGGTFEGLAKYDDAETYLNKALEKAPENQEVAAALVRVKSKKEPEEDSKEALYKLGLIYEAEGLYSDAKTHFEEAVKKDPTYKEAVKAMERVLDKGDSAQRYYDLAGKAAQWATHPLLMKRLEKHTPESQAELLNHLGYLLADKELYDEAIAVYWAAADAVPDWYLPYWNLGDVYSYHGLQPASIEAYNKALEHVLDDSKEYQIIGVAQACSQWLMGEKDSAKATVKQIEEGEVTDTHVWYTLACFYSLAEDVDASLVWLKRAKDGMGPDYLDHVWVDPDLKNVRARRLEKFSRLFS